MKTPKQNIVLIGYRGTGKSTVAQKLAHNLNLEVISTDTEFEKTANMSISDFVATHSWELFRDRETEIIKKLTGKAPLIIDCGGGVIVKPENMELLQKNALVFWLTGSPETLAGRLAEKTDRPPLTDRTDFLSEIKSVLQERTPLYKKYADFVINTEKFSPAANAKTIKSLYLFQK